MDNRQDNSWQYLLERYFNNTISSAEMEELLGKLRQGGLPGAFKEALQQRWNASSPAATGGEARTARFEALLQQQVPAGEGNKPRAAFRLRRLFRVAAAVLLLVAAGSYYLLQQRKYQPAAPLKAPQTAMQRPDLPPGAQGAILKLGNGQEIVLDSAGNGVLAVQGNIKVVRRNNQLYYEGKDGQQEVLYNTITTPRGRQYQLVLSDGSRVWLNAASSIRYPTAFTGNKRVVEVSGEVYFEVAKWQQEAGGRHMPFVVSITGSSGNRGQVEVLGTHFNINAYEDEPALKTTLLEGSVKVTTGKGKSSVLQPGQQSAVGSDGNIRVIRHVNVNAVMAWKNGYFSFAQTDLATVMRQIGRWYDVDIIYEGSIPERKFGGEIPRDNNASEVLKILEETGVRCRIEGRKIIVAP